MTGLDVLVALGLAAGLAAYAAFFEQGDRAGQVSHEQEEAAFATAVGAGRGLEFAQQRIDSFVAAAPPLYWMLGALAVLEARSVAGPLALEPGRRGRLRDPVAAGNAADRPAREPRRGGRTDRAGRWTGWVRAAAFVRVGI